MQCPVSTCYSCFACTGGSKTAPELTSNELLLDFLMFVQPKYPLVAIQRTWLEASDKACRHKLVQRLPWYSFCQPCTVSSQKG